MQRVFEKIITAIQAEMNDVIVKDTYSRGKRAGLRKAEIIVNQVASEYGGGVCEHKYHRTIDDVRMFKTSCMRELSEDCVKKYEFCPYCGKTIIRLIPDKPSKASDDILNEVRRIDRMTRERMSEPYKAESENRT